MSKELVYINPFDSISGYAAAGRDYLYCLLNEEFDIKAVKHNEPLKALLLPDENELIHSLCNKSDQNLKCPQIYNTVPNFWRSSTHYDIGFCYWETDLFPEMWVEKANVMNELWVNWDGMESAMRRAGVNTQIKIIPPAINIDTFNPDIAPMKLEGKSGFIFMSIFQFSYRKGADILLKAYLEEFDVSDDVCLVLKTYGYDTSFQAQQETKEWVKNIKKRIDKKNYPKVLFRGSVIPNNVFPNFLKAADVYVCSSRGEALCYPVLQSMACGVPAIVTGWGGQNTFCNKENGWLIDYQMVSVAGMNHLPYYKSNQKWAEPNRVHLRSLMREAFENEELRKQKAELARKEIEKFSYERTGKLLGEMLNERSN